jgi:hypothetical protein
MVLPDDYIQLLTEAFRWRDATSRELAQINRSWKWDHVSVHQLPYATFKPLKIGDVQICRCGTHWGRIQPSDYSVGRIVWSIWIGKSKITGNLADDVEQAKKCAELSLGYLPPEPDSWDLPESLDESYCAENSWLFQYLREKPVSISNHWQELMHEWADWEYVLSKMGMIDDQVEELEDVFEEFCHPASEIIHNTQELLDSYVLFMMSEHPAQAPTWAHMSVEADRLLPASTWLVHWTDNAHEVALDGFNHGIGDIETLGLTTHYNDGAKRYGGYNFAYLPDRNDATYGGKYGKNCVMFQSSGVMVHHYGDSEHQVIFWGAGIISKPIAIIQDNEQWVVYSTKLGRSLVRFDRVQDCWSWVRHHWRQYQAALQ